MSLESSSYTANSLNQYTAVGPVAPTYDTNGNLTSDGAFTYTYDAENRLVSAVGAGHTASYTYDAQGQRKTKTVDGTTTGIPGTQYLIDASGPRARRGLRHGALGESRGGGAAASRDASRGKAACEALGADLDDLV